MTTQQGSGQKCGSTQYCYYIDIYPIPGQTVSESITITSVSDGVTVHFINITSITNICTNPVIDVIYEQTNFDALDEYIEIFERDINGVRQLARCGDQTSCGTFATCLEDYPISSDTGNTIELAILQTNSVNPSCPPYSLNLDFTITCGGNATFPDLPSTTDEVEQRVQCGQNTWCYDVVLDPKPNIVTTETVHVFSETDGEFAYHLIDVRNFGFTCINPTIDVIYEEIDYNTDSEYFDVFEEETLISRCGKEQYQCDVFATCVDDEPLSVSEIKNGDLYRLSIIQTDSVHQLCPPYSLNVELTITCGGDAFPQLSTTTFINTFDETVDVTESSTTPFDGTPSGTSDC